MFNFKCPYCGTSLEAEDNYVGKCINCPACTEVLVVPDQFMPAGTEFAGYTIQDVVCANMLWTTYRAIGVSKSFGKTVMLRVPTTFIRNQSGNMYKNFSAVARSMGTIGIDEFPELIENSVEGTLPYFVFDSYPDCTVVRHLNVSSTFKSSYDCLRVIRKMAAALMRLWEDQKLVVQSIKPDNLCYYANGKLHMMDVGISQFALQNPDLLNSGLDIWDTAYTAPELIETGSADKPQSDIFSLGGVLFFLLTGRDPSETNPITVYNASVPNSINQLYQEMTERSTAVRMSDYKALLREIDTILKEDSAGESAGGAVGASYHETSTMSFDMSGLKEEMQQASAPAFDLGSDDDDEPEENAEPVKKKSKLPLIIIGALVAAGAAAAFILLK